MAEGPVARIKEEPNRWAVVETKVATSEGSPTGVSPDGRDLLLATKLYIPRPRSGYLTRPQLIERLTRERGRGILFIAAPAGFGKTSLLGDWADRSEHPVAWLSLDDGDSDPVRFWCYVASALDPIRPGLGARVAPLTLANPPSSPDALAATVINEVARESGEVTLVLDDYHHVAAPAVHRSLAFLLERRPPQLHIVIASRSDPPLPLARLRAAGQLGELRSDDLRFTGNEMAALLREVAGLELPRASVDSLAERTEGWVAGIVLAALSLRGQRDPVSDVERFSGSNRYVFDYLTDEVLDRQPESVMRFLLDTSVLSRLTASLCDAVTGRNDSQGMLEEIERANLFLVPLDDERGWWRYHPLFADVLRRRLDQVDPNRARELSRQAASWSEAQGLVDDAVRYASVAGDVADAARMIEQHAQALLERGEGATLDAWLARVPTSAAISPQLFLARAVTALGITGRPDDAERWLDEAERAAGSNGSSDPALRERAIGMANVWAMLAVLRAELARLRGDTDGTLRHARRGLELASEHDPYLRYLARWNLSFGAFMRGQLDEAEAALIDLGAERWAMGQQRYFGVRTHYTLGQIRRAQGRLSAAFSSCEQALLIATDPVDPPTVSVEGIAQLGFAEVLFARGDLNAAGERAERAVDYCRQLGYGQWLVRALTILAAIRQAQGDTAGAQRAIDDALAAQPEADLIADLISPLAVQRGRLQVAQGRVDEASRWIHRRGLALQGEPSFAREGEYLLLARVLLAEQNLEQLLTLLGQLRATAALQKRVGSLVEISALQALAHAAAGDDERAQAALIESISLGWREGYVQVYVDEGAPMAAVLGKVAASMAANGSLGKVIPPAFVAGLVEAFDAAGAPVFAHAPRGRAALGLLVPLSDRELEVLSLIAAGQPNQAIADELVITLDTVKRHVTHILDKLGAINRTEAVSRGRELGVLK